MPQVAFCRKILGQTKSGTRQNVNFGSAQIEYDYKSYAPQFAYDGQSMALGQDQSTPRAIDFPIIGSFGAYDFLNLDRHQT